MYIDGAAERNSCGQRCHEYDTTGPHADADGHCEFTDRHPYLVSSNRV
jgi:hypothetical protein